MTTNTFFFDISLTDVGMSMSTSTRSSGSNTCKLCAMLCIALIQSSLYQKQETEQ